MKKYIGLSILLLTLFSCSDSGNDNGRFSMAPDSKQDISVTDLSLERIVLDSIPSSYVIESGVINEDKVYFLDRHLCEINIFDANGKFIEKKLGIGHARNETDVGRIAGSTFCNNNNFFFYDKSGGCSLYDENILKDDYFRIYYNRDLSRKEKNPENNPINYTNSYHKFICRNYKNSIYFNVTIGLPEFGFMTHTNEYFTRAGNIIELDLQEKKFTNVLAEGYPETYTKDPYGKLHFIYINFDIDEKGNFYISYEADPYIYVYDSEFKNIACYGLQGKDMSVDYVRIEDPSWDTVYGNQENERKEKGHYTWLEYEDKTKTLFRSYQKGGENERDGLQIYRDGVLIGDVEVPKSLRVMDYIHPYYYSYIIPDEEGEKMEMYRFKIDK